MDATSLGAQISAAVAQATSPSSSQQQQLEAYTFFTQLKQAHQETWQPCWSIFLQKRGGDGGAAGTSNGGSSGQGVTEWQWTPQERMLSLQVVIEAVPHLPPDALAYVQSSLFDYFASEYVTATQGPQSDSNIPYLKNTTVSLLLSLFLHLYPTSPLLSTLLQLPRTPASTVLVLKVLHSVSEEISDVQLRLNKGVGRLNKDAELRDSIRENDAANIASFTWSVLEAALSASTSSSSADSSSNQDIIREAIRTISGYVSWIDINLTVTPSTIPLLVQALHHPTSASIRIATLECLLETVSKGMPAGDKLALLDILNLPSHLERLMSELAGSQDVVDPDDEGREKIARVLNAVGMELVKILEDSNNPVELKSRAGGVVPSLLPLLLTLLSAASPSQLVSLTPFTTSLLGVYKKEKKRLPAGQEIPEDRRVFLERLLETVVRKMEWDETSGVEWECVKEGEEDEDMLVFSEMRKGLVVMADAIAFISPALYAGTVRSLVVSTLDAFELNHPVPWSRLELSLFLLHSYGQALNTPGPGAFVLVPESEIQRAKREPEYRIDYTQFALSPLGEMMVRVCKANVLERRSGEVEPRHTAVGVGLFEVVVRYNEFFKLCPEYIGGVLEAFLGNCGLHQDDEAAKARVSYLFSRFIIGSKTTFQAQVSGEFVESVLRRVQDLLTVTASLPDDEPLSDELLTKVSTTSSLFDSQLYLFESVGSLISILNQIPAVQVTLLTAIISPLLAGLQQVVKEAPPVTKADYEGVLLAHHYISAVGNVAKGFPDLSARSPVPTGEWVGVLKEATGGVLETAKLMGGHVCIRNAARAFFNRMVSTTGIAILPLIPTLIECLLGQVTFAELSELLSFLGLLVAKYKLEFLPILDTLLLPVFTRVFYFLELPIAGTDDMIQHSTLRRAYFNFILSICQANLQEVFYSEKNKPQLQSIFQSITHYIANDSLAPDQRFGLGVLNRFMGLWVETYLSPTSPPVANPPPPSPVPGFEQFLYLNAVKLCFEIPLRPEFDYSDAQSFSVIGEIANLLKGLLQKRGNEFLEFMNGTLFPSLQCPPEAAQRFMTALQEAPDGKQFKKFASEWLRTSRSGTR